MINQDSPVHDDDRSTPVPGSDPLSARTPSGIFALGAGPGSAAERRAAPLSQRERARGIDGLKALIRRSPGLSMQETLAFACAFMDDLLELSCVAVVHDRAPIPLVWGAAHVSQAALGRAATIAHGTVERIQRAEPDDPHEIARREGEAAAGSLTLPLAIPLLGVIHLEGAGLTRDGATAFLRHAIILLSLALDRGVDCEPSEGRRRAAPEPPAPLSQPPHEMFASALVVAQQLIRTLDGTPGTCRYAADALRVARAMTLNVIDVLELHAEPPRAGLSGAQLARRPATLSSGAGAARSPRPG